MNKVSLSISIDRLMDRLHQLGEHGALEGGGTCRLALTDADKGGRDLVTGWMKELGMQVTIDAIGNVIGVRPGSEPGNPVMTGSHIDTVATGGIYDGNLGVLAGLEVVATLNDAGIRTKHPLAVAFFTNEEGARFAPDMLGSSVYSGFLPLYEALASVGIDGASLGDELTKIGYAGTGKPGAIQPRAFVELHIEQGPALDREGLDIGCVTGVQGIHWQELTLTGTSNHAGTAPMNMRRDAGLAAASIASGLHEIALAMGGEQVATVGRMVFSPNLVNVVASKVEMTLDIRNPNLALWHEARQRADLMIERVVNQTGVGLERRLLAEFDPVVFDDAMVQLIETTARELGLSSRRMCSGAGHDAGLMSRICPTAMIFVPSKDGISHNIKEYTSPKDLRAGADVLLHALMSLLEPLQE